jgi:outer membrane murein-binding lipoprotein Lpp
MSAAAMAFAAGMAWGGLGSDSTNRLDALSARMTRLDGQVDILERLAHDSASALDKLIERATLVSQVASTDREQLNHRVAGLENDRIGTALIEQRLRAIETILKERLPSSRDSFDFQGR